MDWTQTQQHIKVRCVECLANIMIQMCNKWQLHEFQNRNHVYFNTFFSITESETVYKQLFLVQHGSYIQLRIKCPQCPFIPAIETSLLFENCLLTFTVGQHCMRIVEMTLVSYKKQQLCIKLKVYLYILLDTCKLQIHQCGFWQLLWICLRPKAFYYNYNCIQKGC